jgi:hypothetical protein
MTLETNSHNDKCDLCDNHWSAISNIEELYGKFKTIYLCSSHWIKHYEALVKLRRS